MNKQFYEFTKLRLAMVKRKFRTETEVLNEINGYYLCLKELGMLSKEIKQAKCLADNVLIMAGKVRHDYEVEFYKLNQKYELVGS